MLMTPGSAFTNYNGKTYAASNPYPIEIDSGDVGMAIKNGWHPQAYGFVGTLDAVPRWFRVGNGLSYAFFSTAATSLQVPLFMLPAHGIIQGIKIRHTLSFTGGSISAYTLSVGDTNSATQFASAANVFQAPGSTVYQLSSNFYSEDALAATQIYVTATSVGANLSAATAGTAFIWALLSQDQ